MFNTKKKQLHNKSYVEAAIIILLALQLGLVV